jgi:hypothetical protein
VPDSLLLIEIEMKEQKKAYHKAEKILIKGAVAILGDHFVDGYAYDKRFKGFILTDSANLYITCPWTKMWIEK